MCGAPPGAYVTNEQAGNLPRKQKDMIRSNSNLSGLGPLGLKSSKPAGPRRALAKANQSDAIRESARGETCALRLSCCNHDPATTIFAHLRIFGSAGVGQKPPDNAGVYACSSCHDAIDRRGSGDWNCDDLLRALLETQRKLIDKGLMHLGRI